MKLLIEVQSKERFLVKDLSKEFCTKYGNISANQLQSKEAKVVSTKQKEFLIIEPTFKDLRDNFAKGPQTINDKDIGLIIAKTGLNKHATVLDAGGGSGRLALTLAQIVKQVTIYEKNAEHYDIISKNATLTQTKNITLKHANIYDEITERELDMIHLDLPEPEKALDQAAKALKTGGHLVIYLPHITQIQTALEALKKEFYVQEVIELLERKWKINKHQARPDFNMLGHTAFLIFARKFS